jgi:hypothetical protein
MSIEYANKREALRAIYPELAERQDQWDREMRPVRIYIAVCVICTALCVIDLVVRVLW